MKMNVGGIDRVVRVVLGLGVLGAGYYFQSYWGLIGLVFVVSAAMGWCPFYRIFGMSTCPTKSN